MLSGEKISTSPEFLNLIVHSCSFFKRTKSVYIFSANVGFGTRNGKVKVCVSVAKPAIGQVFERDKLERMR